MWFFGPWNFAGTFKDLLTAAGLDLADEAGPTFIRQSFYIPEVLAASVLEGFPAIRLPSLAPSFTKFCSFIARLQTSLVSLPEGRAVPR